MGAIALVNPNLQFFNNVAAGGGPLISGKVYTYITGTATPTPTYTNPDLAGGHENSNPIVLDGNGRCVMYLPATPGIKILVTTSADVTVYTQDLISQAVVVT